MSMETTERCAGKVWDGSPCRNKPKIDGYCKIHHPATIEAKAKARHEKWAREYEAFQTNWKKREEAEKEQARRADCFDGLVGALKSIKAYWSCHENLEGRECERCNDVVAWPEGSTEPPVCMACVVDAALDRANRKE